MNTKQIKSERYPQIVLTIDNGEFLCLMDEILDKNPIENDEYAFELYRVLKKADEMGAFDKLKGEEEAEDIEVIFIKEIPKNEKTNP